MQELESLVGEVIYNTTGRPLTSDEVRSFLPGCDGYIAGLDTIDRDALSAADRLQVIARYGVGIDNVDLPAAMEKGILVTVTPGANSASVAELAVGLILALARRIPEAISATRMGEWPRMSGLSIEGKNVGLLGMGAIGMQVSRRLSAFDCRLLAYDPYRMRASPGSMPSNSYRLTICWAVPISLASPAAPAGDTWPGEHHIHRENEAGRLLDQHLARRADR
jgi:D-3-phosphoglycerate dehydrogenase